MRSHGNHSAPEMIGKYRVVRELGRGASSVVYLAEDNFNNRIVAIKLMYPAELKDDADAADFRTMFVNEAALAGKVIHPHIVTIYDAVVEDEMSYIVMEYVDGTTLERHCKPDHLLETPVVAEIIFKCVRALAFAHMEGLIHRDVKPGNILHRGGTEIKVADFGAAFNRGSDRTQIDAVGSPLYMAPELIKAGDVKAGVQTDIYALGMVMYMLLTGHPPFEASSAASLAYQIVHHDPVPPTRFRPKIPLAIEAIVQRAIAKDPAKRFQNWEEFGKALTTLWTVGHAAHKKKGEPSEAEHFALLRALPFFANFPEAELWEVQRMGTLREVPPGTVLLNEGEIGDAFYVLLRGSVKVTRGKRLLNVLSTGEPIGEMAYLAKQETARSATVTTTTEALVIKLQAADLRVASATCRQLFDQKFLETLVDRLLTANQRLAVT